MTIAETTSGPVQGRIKDGVVLFAGIPYAAPPVGPLRFRAPQPPEPWQDIRKCTRFGRAAPQVPNGASGAAAPNRWSEDCLAMNIFTPAVDGGRRPVLVWIHGGGYRTGQGALPWYNGARFARQGDLVVVTINYRLGALGFTDLSRFGSEYASSGVNGLLDQILALRWVQDNIERFGGDPAKVTIAGESAGGFSVCCLLASPLARGLFRGAIPQSGGAQHTMTPEAGAAVADLLLTALDIEDPRALEFVPPERMLAAQLHICTDIGEGAGPLARYGLAVPPFYPVQGHPVLPEPPLAAIARGASRDIPVMTGTNRHESTLWGFRDVDDAELERMVHDFRAPTTLPVYRRTRPCAPPHQLVVAFLTDLTFRIPAIRLLEARERAGAAAGWMYWFCWETRADPHLGATHALQVPFVFDNLDRPGVAGLIGPGERPQQLADRMHDAFTRFVRDLDPGWPAYRMQHRATMRFAEHSELLDDPDGAERRAWDGLR